ncbi:uncharacterized protein LOC131882599 isoform X2 [Tigriopus californicus]|uniref:uncharacterized protein LOC131882599 isoform X2 n=1 Tax=Tigriopus californicus TaxID=6832 RepID=UPI0027D9EDCC|nr:uncharacterized protein LOC131882599 isoform X2 [Tigriopus californicus]
MMLLFTTIFYLVNHPLWSMAIVIRGTTVGPDFNRIMGGMADVCSPEFPWAFDNGRKCCRTYSVTNRSQPLQYEDTSSKCKNNNWIDCPNTRYFCVSYSRPHHCPQPSSVGLNAGCCTAALERWAENENPPCRGFKIQENTPSTCCPSEHFTFVQDCANNQQRCLSSGQLPHVLYPIKPIILEEESWTRYDASFALVNAHCDIFRTNYWVAYPVDSYFIIDWGYHLVPQKLILRNSYNSDDNNRLPMSFLSPYFLSNHKGGSPNEAGSSLAMALRWCFDPITTRNSPHQPFKSLYKTGES